MKILRLTLPPLIPRDPLLIKVLAVVMSLHFLVVGIIVFSFTQVSSSGRVGVQPPVKGKIQGAG